LQERRAKRKKVLEASGRNWVLEKKRKATRGKKALRSKVERRWFGQITRKGGGRREQTSWNLETGGVGKNRKAVE